MVASVSLHASSWAQVQLAEMSLDEKIGQLFVVPVCPKRTDDGHFADLLTVLKTYHVGNLIVKQSDPLTQVQFLNQLQKDAKRPLIVCADAEWGLAMRMSDTIAYPRNMTLGAIQNLSLIEELGKEIGRQAKRVGIHLNLAPVADVNNNPQNPIIHMRSFGENQERVAECVVRLVRGMQSAGVFACAKHFPGHGNTSVDSHCDLPVIAHSEEFMPFQRAVDEGVAALMTAHLYVPAVDDKLPTSLSATCLKMAREWLNFKGLIVSDALNMKAIADRYSSQEIALLARKAGCDLLLYGDHIAPNVDQILQKTIPEAFTALKEAYESGDLDIGALDQTVLKILEMKERIDTQVPEEGLMEALHTKEAKELKATLFQEAVTLFGEEPSLTLADTSYLSFGENDVLVGAFKEVSPDTARNVVIAIHQREALNTEAQAAIEKYREKAIVCLFATPYALKEIRGVRTVLLGYENDPNAQKGVLNVLLGKRKATAIASAESVMTLLELE